MNLGEMQMEPAARAAMFVRFWKSPRPENRRTDSWTVTTTDNKRLGVVSWYGRWRCYAFYPLGDTVFERTCLRDLAEFCQERTTEHRKSIHRAAEKGKETP